MFIRAILLLASYVAAAPLTDKISMDMTKTEWANLWTYVWWILSGVVCLFILGCLLSILNEICDSE